MDPQRKKWENAYLELLEPKKLQEKGGEIHLEKMQPMTSIFIYLTNLVSKGGKRIEKSGKLTSHVQAVIKKTFQGFKKNHFKKDRSSIISENKSNLRRGKVDF